MKLPKKIRIGYKGFKVEPWKSESDTYGVIDYKTGLIKIKDDLDDEETANTLIHEILHGIFYETGLSLDMKYDEEEKLVFVLANSICRFFLENPKLVKEFLTTRVK